MKQIRKRRGTRQKGLFGFALLAALLLTLTWAFASENLSEEINANIVRLHILANSDTEADQKLKLLVRDRLLQESGRTPELLTDAEIVEICENEIKKNGFAYPVSVERGRFHFPQKSYENVTLPAGMYHAVRIIIGRGEGQNWWCVMYPPLCFTGETRGALSDEALSRLQKSISPECFAMICESDSISIKPSFKLVELWQELKSHGSR